MSDVCRFCLSDENEKSNPLLAPCNCTGSVRFVHRTCLNHWRSVTIDAQHKIRCQLCHAPYLFQRRWLEEVIPIPCAFWNNVLSHSFIIIAVVHYLHLIALTHIANFLPKDPQLTTHLLHSKPGIYIYYALLGFVTLTYTVYYVRLYNLVRNRQLYFYFGAFEMTRFFAIAALCLYLVQLTIFPFGFIYIFMLSSYRQVHNGILQEINMNGTF